MTTIVAIGMSVIALIVTWDIAMAEMSVDGVSTLICISFLLLVLICIEAGGVVTAVVAIRVGMVTLIIAWDVAMGKVSVDIIIAGLVWLSFFFVLLLLALVVIVVVSGRVVICGLMDGRILDSNVMLDNVVSSVIVT